MPEKCLCFHPIASVSSDHPGFRQAVVTSPHIHNGGYAGDVHEGTGGRHGPRSGGKDGTVVRRTFKRLKAENEELGESDASAGNSRPNGRNSGGSSTNATPKSGSAAAVSRSLRRAELAPARIGQSVPERFIDPKSIAYSDDPKK